MKPIVPSPMAVPAANLRYAPVPGPYGTRLALVFGNHAPEGVCPYLTRDRCHHCDIGMGEGGQFDVARNRERLAWFESHYRADFGRIAQLVVYNSGSVLSPAELPFDFLAEILAFARKQPAVQVVSLDSRESFVTRERVLRVVDALRGDQCARIIIGVESADDVIRNQLLQKQMPRKSIVRAFDAVAAAMDQCGAERVGVDVNILVGGPGTTPDDAAHDAAATARFALSHCRAPVDFNLHPYYVSRRGRLRFGSHARCSWDVTARSVNAVMMECRTAKANSRLFVGANDEGHDLLARSADSNEEKRWLASIERFNATQDVLALKAKDIESA